MTGPEELAETIVSDVRLATIARGMTPEDVDRAFELAANELSWIEHRDEINAAVIRQKVAELIAAEREAS